MIRLATEADADAVAAIYAPYVRDTAISFETEPPGVDEMRSRIRAVLAWAPWLVCERDGRAVGRRGSGSDRQNRRHRHNHCRHLQGPLGNRVVLQGPQTEPQGEEFRGQFAY